MLSYKTEAFIVSWNKLLCFLLTEIHTSLLSLKVRPPWFCLISANRRQNSAPVHGRVCNIPRSL